jgi:geranylgeranylglycerol-phosphate geranylgeranyltransferase
MMLKIASIFKMLRIGNMLIAFFGTLLGVHSSLHPDYMVGFLYSLAMALLAGAGNIDNDVVDIEVDRMNRPDRVLPSNILSAGFAQQVSWAIWGCGVAILFVQSVVVGIWGLAVVGILVVYNRYAKGTPFLGNVLVALLCAQAIVLPWVTMGFTTQMLIGACFAFIFTFAREIIKDMEDVSGDAALGLRTGPIVKGMVFCKRLATAVIVLGVVSVLLVVAHVMQVAVAKEVVNTWVDLSYIFAVLVVPFAVLPGVLSIYFLHGKAGGQAVSLSIGYAQKLLKLAMVGGIVAIAAGVSFAHG